MRVYPKKKGSTQTNPENVVSLSNQIAALLTNSAAWPGIKRTTGLPYQRISAQVVIQIGRTNAATKRFKRTKSMMFWRKPKGTRKAQLVGTWTLRERDSEMTSVHSRAGSEDVSLFHRAFLFKHESGGEEGMQNSWDWERKICNYMCSRIDKKQAHFWWVNL